MMNSAWESAVAEVLRKKAEQPDTPSDSELALRKLAGDTPNKLLEVLCDSVLARNLIEPDDQFFLTVATDINRLDAQYRIEETIQFLRAVATPFGENNFKAMLLESVGQRIQENPAPALELLIADLNNLPAADRWDGSAPGWERFSAAYRPKSPYLHDFLLWQIKTNTEYILNVLQAYQLLTPAAGQGTSNPTALKVGDSGPYVEALDKMLDTILASFK